MYNTFYIYILHLDYRLNTENKQIYRKIENRQIGRLKIGRQNIENRKIGDNVELRLNQEFYNHILELFLKGFKLL